MQIADVQERLPVNPDTLKLIDLSVRKEKPDLIVFTGDQIAGYYPCFKNDTEKNISEIIALITATADELDIPYCFTFGNHDSDSGMSNRQQFEKIYSRLPGFVVGELRNEEDTGTFSLQIKNSKGTGNVLNLYLFDSNKKGADGTYDPVSAEQIQWYRRERERIGFLPSVVFQHIPVPEYYNVLEKSKRFSKGSVEAFDDHKNEYYVLPEKLRVKGNFMYESPATPVVNTGEIDAFSEKSDILGVFCGHDHNNSFVAEYKGIKLGYTQGCGFNTYGPGKERGVRLFVFDENDIKDFKTYTLTMADFGEYKPAKPMLEFILSNMPSSINEVRHAVKDALRVTGAISLIALTIRFFKK